eukprot:4135082-Pyramimonas_sp.AAC.1
MSSWGLIVVIHELARVFIAAELKLMGALQRTVRIGPQSTPKICSFKAGNHSESRRDIATAS